jgi:hypothetical protein
MNKMTIAKVAIAPALILFTWELPALSRPAPIEPDTSECYTYGSSSDKTSSSISFKGGANCRVDRFISVGITIQVDGKKVLYTGGSSSATPGSRCTLRKCAVEHTVSNPPGRQKFEMLVEARIGKYGGNNPRPGNVKDPSIGGVSGYTLTYIYTHYA